MKNFFSSPTELPDFQNFSLKLDLIQKELRNARDDNARILKDLSTIVKGMAILVTQPEPEEVIGDVS